MAADTNGADMSEKSFSPEMERDFLKKLLDAERRYTIVERVNVQHVIAAILKKDFERAVTFYLDKYSAVPDLCILDMDKNTMQEINALNLNFRVKIVSPHTTRKLLFKKLCLWIDPLTDNERGPGRSSLLVGIRRMDNFGFRNYLIDSHSFSLFKLHYGEFYAPALSPETFDRWLPAAMKVYYALHDRNSREIFLCALRARLDGCFSFFQRSAYPEYYHPECQAEPNDTIIDGGIWDSRILGKFSEVVGARGHIYAFEPLSSAYLRTREQIKFTDNVTLENMGLSKAQGEFFITQQGEGSHLLDEFSTGAERCVVTDIDSYVEKNAIQDIDMIKLDIEGAEPDALRGAVKTITKFLPKLVISIYHSPLHQLIEIPSMILDLNLGYKIWIGHHTEVCFGTVLYART